MKKLKLKTDEHYKEYENLLFQWAHIYTRWGLGEFEDMKQEASMMYLKACDTHDMERGAFSTHLVTILRNNGYDMLRKEYREPDIVSLDEEINSEDGFTYLDLLENNEYYMDGQIMQLLYKGFNMTEIADLLDVSRSTAYRKLEKERKDS